MDENTEPNIKAKEEPMRDSRRMGIFLLFMGFLWFPFAIVPGPGFGVPWITSPWWLLWPMICLALSVPNLIALKRNRQMLKNIWLNIAIILNMSILTGSTYAIYTQNEFRHQEENASCVENLSFLGMAMHEYADSHNSYPPPSTWCDSVLTNTKKLYFEFVCHSSKTKFEYISVEPNNNPPREQNLVLYQHKEDGQRIYMTKICTYSMNPYCEPNSPNDIVFCFESKPGWNQSGGPELLNFDNHKPKRAYVLCNNGDVRYITPENVGKLKWKAGDVNNVQ